MLRRATQIALFVVAATAQIISAQDWAQWRGPNRDGVSSEKGLLKSWPEGGPPLAWQA